MKKLIIAIMGIALSVAACTGHSEQVSLSTKNPVVNKVQLSGYIKTDYTVKDISSNYDINVCQYDAFAIITDNGYLHTTSCYAYYNGYINYYKTLFTIDNKENKTIIENLRVVNLFPYNIHAGYNPMRDNKNNVFMGNADNVLLYYSYDFTKYTDTTPIFYTGLATSSDGDIGITLSYNSDESLSLNQFNAYNLSGLTNILNIKSTKNIYNYLATKIISKKAIVNIATNPSVNKSTNGAFIYDLVTRRVHSISANNDMEKLHFDVIYNNNILIGIDQLQNELPKLEFIDLSKSSSIKSTRTIPNVTVNSIIKIVDYSSTVMYYTVTDNGVTNGYFYNMVNNRFYEDNDIIQILTNYQMDDSKLSTVSLSQNDKYLLLNFKYDSVTPTVKPYITKIVFDDSFSNFLNDKIIPIDKCKNKV